MTAASEPPVSAEESKTIRLAEIRALGDAAPELSAVEPDEPPRSRRRRKPPAGDVPLGSRRYGDGQVVVEIVNPRAPRAMARQFVASQGMVDGRCVLRYWRGQFYRWTAENQYRVYSEADLRGAIYAWTEQTRRIGENDTPGGWCNPAASLVGNVVDALGALVLVESRTESPAWVTPIDPGGPAPIWLAPASDLSGDKLAGDRPPAGEFIAVAGGLLHLPSRELWPSKPEFFAVAASPVVWDEDAEAPLWHQFLAELWPDDPASIETLGEIFGYFVSGSMTQQRIPMLIGPPRSGKGTIARVLTAMVGAETTCNPSLADLGGNFGLAPLIGKSLAIISDARIGRRTDQHSVLERLLAVSGEDGVTIDRKHQPAWTGRLRTRFFPLSNELPQIGDTAGALASRLVLLMICRSFVGREDQELTEKLIAELSGILCWAVEGWHRLRARGRFVQPESGAEALRVMRDLASPIGAFLRDCCEVEPSAEIGIDELHAAYGAWREGQGLDGKIAKSRFGRDLRAACPGIGLVRPRVLIAGGQPERPRAYSGIRLR